MMPVIQEIVAREILDSRGYPTLEAEVLLSSGHRGRALVPSGASVGSREACERRDGGSRLQGKGVKKSVALIQTDIAKALTGFSVSNQAEIDNILIALDGTPTKQRLGANAILAVSLACCRAAAKACSQPLYRYLADWAKTLCTLPVPLLNILNGGVHADNALDIQEVMIVPAGATSLGDALDSSIAVYHALKAVLKKAGYPTAVGDEGGFAPPLASLEEALTLLMQAIVQAGFQPGKEIFLALDMAANELYQSEYYVLKGEKQRFDREAWIACLKKWVETYPILSIEDAMAESDFLGWQQLTDALGQRVQLVGDDVFVTHAALLREGIKQNMANAILIKPNQVGTLTETLETVTLAKQAGYHTIISHRSGETEDPFISDLAVGWGSGQIKIGAPCRSERTAKYNQLLRISEASLPFAGKSAFASFLARSTG